MSLKKQFARYAIPSVVSMWVFSVYTMVDGMFVAWGVGETALAAVNISLPFTNFIFALSLLFSAGTSTVTAILSGEGNYKRAGQVFTMNTVVLAAIGALIVAASLLMLDPMARMLGATESTFGYVTDYLRIIICFAPCFIISYSLEVLIKTDGFPQLATVGIIASALLNCVLDYLFVLVFHWGVTGAAVATGLAQLFLVLLFLHHFLKRKGMLKFQRFPWTFGIYRKILSIGMADCVTEMSIGIVVFLFNRTILSHIGEAAIVSYTVISYVNNLVLMTTTGIAQGMQPLSSFYYGKRDSASCHRLLRYGLVCVTAASLIAFAIGQLLAGPIVGIYIDGQNTQLTAYTVEAFRKFSFSFLLLGYNVLLAGFFTSIAKPVYSMTISLGRGLVLIAVCLAVLPWVFGENGIWFSTLVSEGLCLIPSLFFLNRYRRSAASETDQEGIREKSAREARTEA
ncbi:MATE family efflux transporter [Cuneatibacter caecimuris]|uniref:Multidrug export protein MepA n=1 Tax=Cuneatibacter caecimuris TaxID=1796618 RepID=A0A4Q7P3M0_9FIRM|nr:MATE family efflux transporter [Cuneatibacter caecimuris]RZS94010.1 putative MATE family efflux protein [Cuneatibacter caecimuris]